MVAKKIDLTRPFWANSFEQFVHERFPPAVPHGDNTSIAWSAIREASDRVSRPVERREKVIKQDMTLLLSFPRPIFNPKKFLTLSVRL